MILNIYIYIYIYIYVAYEPNQLALHRLSQSLVWLLGGIPIAIYIMTNISISTIHNCIVTYAIATNCITYSYMLLVDNQL